MILNESPLNIEDLGYFILVFYILRFLSPIFSVKVDAKQAKEFYPPHTKLFKVARQVDKVISPASFKISYGDYIFLSGESLSSS